MQRLNCSSCVGPGLVKGAAMYRREYPDVPGLFDARYGDDIMTVMS